MLILGLGYLSVMQPELLALLHPHGCVISAGILTLMPVVDNTQSEHLNQAMQIAAHGTILLIRRHRQQTSAAAAVLLLLVGYGDR